MNQEPGQPDANNNPSQTGTQNYDTLEWCPTNPDYGQAGQQTPEATTPSGNNPGSNHGNQPSGQQPGNNEPNAKPSGNSGQTGLEASGNTKDSGSSSIGGTTLLLLYTACLTLLITFEANMLN